MVDVAPNHMGYPGAASSVDYSTFTPFNSQQYFHSYCEINYSDENSVEVCWLGDSNVELVDLRTEDEAVYSVYTSWIASLVANYTSTSSAWPLPLVSDRTDEQNQRIVDGLRVDTAKHMNHDFLTKFESASGVFNIGEVDASKSSRCLHRL